MKKFTSSQSNQQGNSTAILVVLLIVVLGMVGWFVYKATSKSTSKATSSQTAPSVTSPTAAQAKLSPAESSTPASGTCAESSPATVVTMTYKADVPDPRCQKVSGTQTLSVVNGTEQTLNVTFGDRKFTLEPKATYTIPAQFNTYLAKGVHLIKFTDNSTAEIWLQ